MAVSAAPPTARASQIMLAMSCDSIQLKKRGSTMWRMTWQAVSVRPYLLDFLTGKVETSANIDVTAGAYTRPHFSSTSAVFVTGRLKTPNDPTKKCLC